MLFSPSGGLLSATGLLGTEATGRGQLVLSDTDWAGEPSELLGSFFYYYYSALEVAMGKLVGQRDSFQGSAESLVGANK